MELKELGEEYMRQYTALMEKVTEIKKKYDTASPEMQRKSRIRIKELLSTAIYLKHTAEKLINYYEKSKRRYPYEKKHFKS